MFSNLPNDLISTMFELTSHEFKIYFTTEALKFVWLKILSFQWIVFYCI